MTTINSSVTTTLPYNVDTLNLTGSADINGTGNSLANTINGNSGANVLDGRSGADTLAGGLGNDSYVVDNLGDKVIENADEGSDTVLSSVSYTLPDNVENLTLTGGGSINGTGNALDNVITGNGGNNTLSGLDGDDTLIGNAGSDVLDGGSGNDTMQGGTGDDTYVVDAAGDSVIEDAGAGADTVRSSISYALGENFEHLVLTGAEDLDASGNAANNTITGNAGANTIAAGAGNDVINGELGDDQLYGELGNDTLNGGQGADIMEGGAGDDVYVVDAAGDIVTEAAGEGLDTTQSGIGYTLTSNVENLVLTGTAAIDGNGNELDNTINGNAGANVLAGLDGNDSLYGNGGDDSLFGGAGMDLLDGGAGADSLRGGSGDDTYVVDNAADLVVEEEGEGSDQVLASVNYTLTGNVENLTLTGAAASGSGNELDNAITGNAQHNTLLGMDGDDVLAGNGGNDFLDGGSGADNMQGGIGDDTYVIDQAGDIVFEAASAGNDTVRSGITYTLTENVDNLVLTGTDNLNGTGNALNNTMTGNGGDNTFGAGAGNDVVHAGEGQDRVYGGDGNDVLNGEAGDDLLFGELGNDTINGGLGADRMEGGSGDDVYVVDDNGDLVIEGGGAGTDLAQSSITYTLTGNVENLTLTGTADIDGAGNELNNLINGNKGANVLDGLAGDDTINANDGNDQLVGGEGDDTLNGELGNDRLQGDSGNDLLNGGAGADTMLGGSGDDVYVADSIADLVVELAGEGVDTVQAGVDFTLSDNVENLTLTGLGTTRGTGNELDNVVSGNNAANALFGLDGDDTLVGNAGNDLLDGGSGADLMQGGAHDDTYVVDNAGDRVEELAGAGTDTVHSGIDYTLTSNVENLVLTGLDDLSGNGNALNNIITGNSGNNTADGGDGADTIHAGAGMDRISGGNGNDLLNGEAGDDGLYGDAGNDVLNGGSGADAMFGGLGDDTFVVDDNGDLVAEAAGEGKDLVQSSITYTLTDNVENLTLTGTADIDGSGNELDNIINGNTGANVLDGKAGNDTINGNAGNDTLFGGEGMDALNGDAGDDLLSGDAGDDVLNGGIGADRMLGGSGGDTYIVDNAGDLVVENEAEGVDTVQSSISYVLTGNVENLVLAGASAINGSGNALDNVITGNNGNNVLDGGTGADTMQGGLGNDTYVVDDAGDAVIEAAGAGTDTVQSSIDYSLGAHVENLVLTGSAGLQGSGNALANNITGNAGNNLIDGGAGKDTMAGGAGDDTYIVDATADVINEAAGGGVDIAYASANYTLSANVENLVLTGAAAINGTGNAQDNSITGNDANNVLSGMAGNDNLNGGAGNDTLDGGSGDDIMAGGVGSDTYVVDSLGDVVTEQAGEGVDTVQSSIGQALGDNLENLVLAGGANLSGSGNALDNVITGNSGNNLLDGQDGNDTLIGGAGNDTLISGAGADSLQGGAGDDAYYVDAADTVVEALGAGADTVYSGASYALGANLENLVLTGDADLDGTGNALANAIRGTAGANVLDGGAGADTLAGGAGDDTYIVDHAGDIVVEAAGEGVDTVHASVSYLLSENVENLVLTGGANINATGNGGDNSLTGNGGANLLDGGAGNDTLAGGAGNDTLAGGLGDDLLDGGLDADLMQGGAGNDTYLVDNAADTIVEAVGDGIDTVYASANHVLGANVEHLVLTGGASLSGTGNALDNTITGNSGDNLLSGMAGNDTFAGGAGNDVLLGGAGDDTYLFGIGDGADRIIDAEGNGTLVIGNGLTAADLEASQLGADLVLTIRASGDSVTLVNWLGQAEGVGRIVFDDGSVLDHEGIGGLLNAAPVAADDSFSVYEDGGLANIPVTMLLANDSDPDAGDVIQVIAVGESSIGAVVGLEDGAVAYDIGARFQELAAGETLHDSFSYTVTDAMGETSTATVNVQIVGVNDAAVTAADTAAIGEDDIGTVSGNVLANDSDVDRGTVLQVAAPGTYQGVYGTLAIAADGSYSYALNSGAAKVQALNAGETVVDTFIYVATDGIEGVDSTLAISITGSNDAPVVMADAGRAIEEDQLSASGNVLANDSDLDAGAVLAVVAPGTYAGAYGSLTLAADGSYTYVLDNASAGVQALAQGQTVVDSFAYAATDGMAQNAATLDIAISGANDGPVVAADAAQLVEDGAASVSGNVLANDSDVDAGTVLAVTGAGTRAGNYGSLTLAADGSYAYALDANAARVQALGRDALATEHFGYTATDGIAGAASTLDIALAGSNDAPIVVNALADRDLTFNKAFSFKMPENSFTDIDQGDKLTYAATLADGSELPSWLKFDAATGTFSGKTPKQVGAIEVRVTATDQVAATGSTEGSLSVSDVFTLKVSHGNEGVGNGEDAAPGGHDGNQNDGPGTSPGNPGSQGGKKAGIGISASNAASGVSISAGLVVEKTASGGLTIAAYLSASQAGQVAPTAPTTGGIGNTTSAQAFGRWLAVDLAVSESLAGKKTLSWVDGRSGADTSALASATAGFLGSTSTFNLGAWAVSTNAGTDLKGFQGLGAGIKKIK